MLVIWKANFSRTEEQLHSVKERLEEIVDKTGEKIDGAYYGQNSDLV